MGRHGYRSHGRGHDGGVRPAYRGERDLPRRDGYRGRHRVPTGLLLIGIALWSALAFGTFVLVDPVLAWFGGAVGPLADAGTGAARWFGLGREAAAVRDVTNVDGLAAWVISVLAIVLKPLIALIWFVGILALFAAPAILSRLRGLRRWH